MNKIIYDLEPSNYKNVNHIQMTCDQPLTTKRTIKPPFLNESGFFMIVVGKPKSGKSTFVFNMITNKEIYKKVFKNIIYVCPETSRGTIKNNPLADLEADHLFDGLDENVYNRIIENKQIYDEKPEKHYQQLLLIDDCTAFLKDSDNVDMLSQLATNRRHISLNIILMTHYVVAIPTSLRSYYNAIVIFKPVKKDYERINKEFLVMKLPQFIDFMDFVFKVRHDNLFINIDNENEYYKNLQRIKIKT
jgi:hypothetical protein